MLLEMFNRREMQPVFYNEDGFCGLNPRAELQRKRRCIMSVFMGLNRRSGRDRRVYDQQPSVDHRHTERRRYGSDRYVLVLGDGGVDRFGLMIGIPVALLLGAMVLTTFVRV